MYKFALAVFLIVIQTSLAFSEISPQTERLVKALQLEDLFEVMAKEGEAYGQSLDAELLDGNGGAMWRQAVIEIYRPGRVWKRFLQDFDDSLVDADINSIVAFSESPLALKIFKLEVSARRALLDKSIEQASAQMIQTLRENDDPRVPLLKQFVEINDLVEFNVMGAMNANYAFYQGLIDGKGIDVSMTDEQILHEVWGQEQAIRDETSDWIYSYLALAYRPLTDAELTAYIEFSQSQAGRGLNAAIFTTFDTLYKEISYQLGLKVAASMHGDDI